MLPVVHREMGAAARRRGTYTIRLVLALVALSTMAWFFLVAAAGGSTAAQGKTLFDTVSVFAFLYALFAGVGATSDCISAEKREGTLGLLFLTDLKGYDIILGKLVSSSIAMFYGLASIVPVLALAIFMGGVTLGQVARVGLMLGNTMFFSIALGIFVSTISVNERKAMFATIFGLLLFSLSIPITLAALSELLEFEMSPEVVFVVLLPSPLLTLMASPVGPAAVRAMTGFFSSVAFVHLQAWLLIVLASHWLPKVCHERPKSARFQGWLDFWRRWAFGEGDARLAHRRRLLDQNAFFWLAARERRKPQYVWLTLGIMAVLWLPAAWWNPDYFADPAVVPALLFILHLLLKIWFTSEVCTRLNEDRRAGALELFLSTPLGVQDIARGQALASRRQFLKPMWAVLGVDLIALTSLLPQVSTENKATIMAAFLAGMLMLPIDLFALKWVGLWRGLTQPKLDRALLGTYGLVLALPWMIFAAVFSLIGLSSFVLGRPVVSGNEPVVFIWVAISLGISLAAGFSARQKFLTEFREIAASRFDGPAVRTKTSLRAALGQLVRRPFQVKAGPRFGFLRRRKWATAFALIVLAGLAAGWFYRAGGRLALEREIAAIRQRGEPVTFDEIPAWLPPIAPQSNAFERLDREFGRMTAPWQTASAKKLRFTWPEKIPRRGPLEPEIRDFYTVSIQINSNALAGVREAFVRPQSRANIPWRSLHDPARPFMAYHYWLQVATLLEMQTILSIDQAQRTETIENIGTLFKLAQILGQEPLMTGQGLRFQALHKGLSGMERFLTAAPPTTKEIHQLHALLRAAEKELLDPASLRRAMICERALFIETSRDPLERLMAFTGMGVPQIPNVFRLRLGFARLSGYWDRQIAQHLRARDALIASLDGPLAEQRQLARNPELSRALNLTMNIIPTPPPFMADTQVEFRMAVLARLRAAQTALALELWRLSQNSSEPPKALKEITPRHIAQIPEDPFTGQPLRYKALNPGYSVFSLGGDEREDERPNGRNSVNNDPGFTVER